MYEVIFQHKFNILKYFLYKIQIKKWKNPKMSYQ